ncbi:hypothetical protein SASPL_150569 [Salvia splendens]|uniref:PPM-type phosphatase domain-containing protein n=1 Tax=Salvia splendens TaxID=180675 RepID=A0A8X8W6T2_SALSN|nr:hypothetical protein SASPL_150569 [Salvia splendens]
MESRRIRVGGLEFRVMGCVYSKAWIGEFCAPRDVKLLESGEKRDQLYQFSTTNDHEAGITRLSRVSAQFLPPRGSKVVKVPSGEYELQCSFLSQRGYYPDALDKANQDSFCIHTAFGTSPDDHFLVFLMVMASLELNALSKKRGNDVVAVDLSIDQTPFRPDELERVKLCGARVLTLDQLEGLKNPHVQSFTRSIGDSTAETIGVVANPEIVVLELTQSHPFFVIASEGVFEFLSSQTVVDMVARHKDPRDACAAIVAESYRRWLQYETRTYDITVIVVHVNGLKEAAFGQLVDSGTILRPSLPQVVEASGSESPSRMNWRSRNQRARHDISRALENSLENGQNWGSLISIPYKDLGRRRSIEQALRDHFLFRSLLIPSGGEGDCFFVVVGDGEFEVLATQVQQATTYIIQLLEVEEGARLGSQGIDSIKAHPWFHDVDWKGLAKHMVVAHPDIYLPYKSTPGNPF